MAQVTHYDEGDVWTPEATFSVGGANTDPTTVTFKYMAPDGTVTTVGPVSGATGGSGINRTATGVYTSSVTLTAVGRWYARFEGTGTAAATGEYEAIVDPSAFSTAAWGLSSRALVTLSEAKDWLNQQNLSLNEDTELVRVINDISDRFHEEAQREFRAFADDTEPRFFDPDPVALRCRTVTVGDLASYTLVRILDRDGNALATVAAGDIISLPRNRPPWEPIRQLQFTADVISLRWDYSVEVTGVWGFPSIPGNVRQAVLSAIASTVDRDVENYRQDLGPQLGGTGTNVVVFPGSPAFLSLPPEALAVARSYRDALVA